REGGLEGGRARNLPVEGLLLRLLVPERRGGVRRPPEEAQRLGERPHDQGRYGVLAVVPEVFDELAQSSLGYQVWLHAAAQPFQGSVQHAERGPTERTVNLAKVAGEAEETNRLGREEMPERHFAGRLSTAKQVRQALFPVTAAQAAGQVDPIP